MSDYGRALQSTSTDVGELSKLIGGLTLEQAQNALSTKGLSKETLKLILQNKGMVAAEAEAVAAKIASSSANGVATFSMKAYTTAIWANIKALWAWMKSNPIGWILMIGTAIGVAVAATNYFNGALDRQKEKLSEVKDEYASLKDELTALDDQIKENEKTITDLQTKLGNNTITLVETDQLKKLERQNALLQQQYAVREAIAKQKNEELADTNRETFEKEYAEPIEHEKAETDLYYNNYVALVEGIKNASTKELLLLLEANEKHIAEQTEKGNHELVTRLDEQNEKIRGALNVQLEELLNYQDTLSQISNDDGSFANIEDQLMWDEIENWKKDIYDRSGREGEWNQIQIKAAIDEDSLTDLQKNLVLRLREGNLTEKDLEGFTVLNASLESANLILEDGQAPAAIYLDYLRSIAASQIAVKSTTPNFSFNSGNQESIDNYQSQLDTLNNALGQLSSGSMTSSGLLDLFQAFPELTKTTGDLSTAIQDLITNKLTRLKKELKDNGASDDVLALFDNLTAEVQNVNLSGILSGLSEMNSSIQDLDKEITDTGKISVETLDDISSKYPTLTDAVEQYLEGKIDEQELLAEMKNQYAVDLDNYTEYMINKRRLDTEFYNDIVDNLSDDLINKAEYYGIDLEAYANYSSLKLALDAEYAKRRDAMLLAKEEYTNNDVPVDGQDAERANYLNTKKELEDYEKFMGEFDTAAGEIIKNFTPDLSFQKDDGDKTDKSDSKTEIDWLEQSLKNLQGEVDKYQTALENTTGLKNQLTAVDDLNAALGNLKTGYTNASEEYEDRYTAALSKIPNSKKIKPLIESGEEFDISVYSGDNEQTGKYIQEAIDAYNAKKEADSKVTELGIQIDDNENLEKSKVRQTGYEKDLEYINAQLNDQTLTADEKNALLDKQYATQKKINDELRAQAKYENDLLTISKLDEEDIVNKKQRDLGKIQNNKDQNQKYIDNLNQKLEDDSLTEDKINSMNKSLKDATDKDFEYQFKEIRATISDAVWNSYIQGLKKQYKETKMSDSDFIKKHIKEIASYFDYKGMDQWLSEYYASNDDFDQRNYDTTKNTRMYSINDNNNKIQDIQNDIALNNGIGTKDQYNDMIGIYRASTTTWNKQLEDAKANLKGLTPNTPEWDKANAEVQDIENNINDCDTAIKQCEASILQLPLTEVQKKLDDIGKNIADIDKQLSEQDQYISAANIVLDEQIEFQEKQKEVIQEQIDALQKEHDLRESNLNVQKAEWNLQKAKNNQSVKVFKEGQGFVFEADADEVNEAQHALDEAIYNNKITQLENQIDTYDEEINRLNDIKESFNSIKSDAEELLILNKARAYYTDFVNKVLASDVGLITTFKNTYQELLTNKGIYETQQEDYSSLYDTIEEIIQKHEEGSLSYEQAEQQILATANQYSPGILGSYEAEKQAIQDNALKRLEEAEITKQTSEAKVETTQKSNEEIILSYINLYNNMAAIFSELNVVMDEFANKTANMASSVNSSISSMLSFMKSLSKAESTLSETVSNATSKSNLTKISDAQSDKLISIGANLLNQSIGMSLLSDAVGALTPYITTTKNSTSNSSVSFTGDIIVNSTGDVNALSKDIVSQLPGAMLQTIFKRT